MKKKDSFMEKMSKLIKDYESKKFRNREEKEKGSKPELGEAVESSPNNNSMAETSPDSPSVEINSISNIIEGRILSEQRKHKALNWVKISAIKIAQDILERDKSIYNKALEDIEEEIRNIRDRAAHDEYIDDKIMEKLEQLKKVKE